jgi:hypothetical protein
MTQDCQADLAGVPFSTPYRIERHHHLFAAWAAGRAASVKGCRFSVEQGRAILEACGFNPDFSTPEQLPPPERIDEQHRLWRGEAIRATDSQALAFPHGVAGKLINIYLKSRFVCGGHHAHERVRDLHPPIDDVLLCTLADLNVGGYARQWRSARYTRWSKLGSDEYEQLIGLIRDSLKGEPLWKIEEYWKGNQ